MPFCTLLEWSKDFDLDGYDKLNERADGHGELPEGRLSRIVGPAGDAVRIMEVWESPDAARRFSEMSSPAITELKR